MTINLTAVLITAIICLTVGCIFVTAIKNNRR
mgnify:CR=1 FL=1